MGKTNSRNGGKMASEFVTKRDGSGLGDHLPPGQNTIQLDHTEALADTGRSFLVALPEEPVLTDLPHLPGRFIHTDLSQNKAFEDYMRMHKVLVGNGGAMRLTSIYERLKEETQPHYLSAAGWAAAEVALVRTDASIGERLSILHDATSMWERALAIQTQKEQLGEEVEYGYMHRIAIDLAVVPLLSGIITGDVTKDACRKSFEDCLSVARSNMDYLRTAKAKGNVEAVGCHAGVGYECNALLALNRKLSRTWFVIPAMARCDSGYYHRSQTHDLVVIHQKYGAIQSATPVEIKSRASLRDRRRYSALLVRGKMHLSVEGKGKPEYTLDAIGSVYDGVETKEDILIAENATNQFMAMIRDYYAGEVLGAVASKHSVTTFRDNTQVIAHHPGLSKVAMTN